MKLLSIITDHVQPIDQLKTNRPTKSDFIKKWLADFSKQNHRPHYSDHFFFDAPASITAQVGGV